MSNNESTPKPVIIRPTTINPNAGFTRSEQITPKRPGSGGGDSKTGSK